MAARKKGDGRFSKQKTRPDAFRDAHNQDAPEMTPVPFSVSLDAGASTTALVYSADRPAAALILAHGAGAGQRHPFMTGFARALAARGLDIITFNFLYTEQSRRLPDRAPVLEACYRRIVAAVRDRVESAREQLFIGGKSMGGRIATQIAATDPALPVRGLVLLGYPLHPPGRPDKRRDAHLASIGRPMLFVQGGRDAFGTPAELTPVLRALTPAPLLRVIEHGDHSFTLPKSESARQPAVLDEAQREIAEWIVSISGSSARGHRRTR